jgi:hypothetical protein
MPKNERVKIGEVGVDSGQVMICDPCYIKNEWKDEEFVDDRFYLHEDGTVLTFRKDFYNYEQVLPKYNFTMNELVAAGKVKKIEEPESSMYPFSYAGCCRATTSEKMAGQLAYEMGHAGAGVVSSSGYGDGCYPVYATYNSEGRIIKLEVKFTDDEEEG